MKDTFEYCSLLDENSTSCDRMQLHMCSFDVVSLFTNVPLREHFKICLVILYRDDNVAPPTVTEKLLKLLIKTTTHVELIQFRQCHVSSN